MRNSCADHLCKILVVSGVKPSAFVWKRIMAVSALGVACACVSDLNVISPSCKIPGALRA